MKRGYYPINYIGKISRTEKDLFTDLKGSLSTKMNEEKKTHFDLHNCEILKPGIRSKLKGY